MKSYFAKIYQPNAKYIDTLKDINFTGFRKQINGGVGELSFSIPKKFDDFDENYLIKLNNRIDLWVNDDDTGTDGLKIYSGFISNYQPTIDQNNESVTIKCLGYVSKLATSILKIGTYIEVTTDTNSTLKTGHSAGLAPEVSGIIRSIIDHYRLEAKNPIVNYSATSIENTGTAMAYIFNGKFYNDAIDKCREIAPENWWWYVGADNILQFRPKPIRATHTFTFGKDFKNIKVEKNMENVVNNVLFSNGDNQDAQILKLFADDTSIDQFDDRWIIKTDGRVSLPGTADRMGESALNENKDSQIKVSIEVLDNNGKSSGYDIESIQPGDTCKFVGFNDITSQTFTDNMQILGVQYTPSSVILEIESLNPSIARENWENKQRMAVQETTGRAGQYDTETDRWIEINTQASGIDPHFENSWVNYGGANTSSCAFIKDINGFVHFKGTMKSGTLVQRAFLLPAGFRPIKRTHLSAYSYNSGMVLALFLIEPTGDAMPYFGSNVEFSIDGLSFRAEQ